ncbi:hypothetical protein BV22DRAFT_137584 [Leucogyrophana mollusca]|uniref:Uncharacterized protein n=1 Tax=Leucogyrophana mollusca TaxID=85980 RepID=A0ACB8BVC5_9AGAM|nr:hypothetical protein BV22DRAFT_137584 [Leucogyrophana mollusca]
MRVISCLFDAALNPRLSRYCAPSIPAQPSPHLLKSRSFPRQVTPFVRLIGIPVLGVDTTTHLTSGKRDLTTQFQNPVLYSSPERHRDPGRMIRSPGAKAIRRSPSDLDMSTQTPLPPTRGPQTGMKRSRGKKGGTTQIQAVVRNLKMESQPTKAVLISSDAPDMLRPRYHLPHPWCSNPLRYRTRAFCHVLSQLSFLLAVHNHNIGRPHPRSPRYRGDPNVGFDAYTSEARCLLMPVSIPARRRRVRSEPSLFEFTDRLAPPASRELLVSKLSVRSEMTIYTQKTPRNRYSCSRESVRRLVPAFRCRARR